MRQVVINWISQVVRRKLFFEAVRVDLVIIEGFDKDVECALRLISIEADAEYFVASIAAVVKLVLEDMVENLLNDYETVFKD